MPKKDIAQFLTDCGAADDFSPADIPVNSLYARTARLMAASYDQRRQAWDDDAQYISELVGITSDPNWLDGVQLLRTMTLQQFQKTIAGNQKAFIQLFLPGARILSQQLNIPIALTISQAAHESNWGKVTLGTRGNHGFNLWGMTHHTGEPFYEPGGTTKWQRYSSFYEGLMDYGTNLRKSGKYDTAWAQFDKDRNFSALVTNIAAIYAPVGAANDPNGLNRGYDQKIMNTVRSYGLDRLS